MSGQPGILCCLVARASVVLAKYIDPQVGANLEDTINQLLANVSPEQESATLKFSESINAHYFNKDGLITMAIAFTTFDRESVFQILMNVERKFMNQFGKKVKSAFALEMDAEFSPQIYEVIKRAEQNLHNKGQLDHIDQRRQQVAQVQKTAQETVKALITKGEKLEKLESDVDDLNETAIHFEDQTQQVERAMWWENMKMTILIATCVTLVMLLIITIC